MSPFRSAGFLLTFGLAASLGVAAARADCNEDVQKMSIQRGEALKSINEAVASAKGKQMDPAVFCTKSQPLISIENKLLAYMLKNQDWCGIPQQIIDQLKSAHEKSSKVSSNACKVAEQMKKAKESGDAGAGGGGPPPLPAGPL